MTFAAAIAGVSTPAYAASTFESATLGNTGETQGIGITTFWIGARLEITEDTIVTSLGAHVTDGQPPGVMFLALFETDDAESFPVCGTTDCATHYELFEPPSASEDVVLPVEVPVTAGHYIIVAGTYSGGAEGTGRLPRTNTPVKGVQWVTRNGSNGDYAWSDENGGLDLEPARLTVVYGICGDGEQDVGEACDDGNAEDTDACVSGCVLASCGDGFVEAGVEECDDGNDDDDDDCMSDCTIPLAGSSSGGEPGSTSDASTSGDGSTTSGDAGSTSEGDSSGGGDGNPGDDGGATTSMDSGGGEAGSSSGRDTDMEASTEGSGGCSISGAGVPAWLLLLPLFRRRRR